MYDSVLHKVLPVVHVVELTIYLQDIRAEEAKKDWKGKKAREIEKMMAASAETLQELEDIIADIEDLDDDREYGTHENKKERDRLLNDKYTLEWVFHLFIFQSKSTIIANLLFFFFYL